MRMFVHKRATSIMANACVSTRRTAYCLDIGKCETTLAANRRCLLLRILPSLIRAMIRSRRTWTSFDEMREAADGGDPQAQCYLGVCYQTGQSVQPDPVEAVRWFRKAADQNDAVAQCYLGFCYQAGQGVPQEFGEAAKWYREAAEQGDPAAQYNLGVLYETGQ